jgi:hypothetical protein
MSDIGVGHSAPENVSREISIGYNFGRVVALLIRNKMLTVPARSQDDRR